MLPAANPDVLSSLLPHPRAPGLTPDAPNRHLSYGRMCSVGRLLHVEHSEPYEGRQEDATPAEKPARKRKAA